MGEGGTALPDSDERWGGPAASPAPRRVGAVGRAPPQEKPPHPGVTKACAQRPQDLEPAGIIT